MLQRVRQVAAWGSFAGSTGLLGPGTSGEGRKLLGKGCSGSEVLDSKKKRATTLTRRVVCVGEGAGVASCAGGQGFSCMGAFSEETPLTRTYVAGVGSPTV